MEYRDIILTLTKFAMSKFHYLSLSLFPFSPEETSECGGSWIRANFKNGEMCYHVLTKDLSLDSCLHQDNYIAFVPNQTDGGAKQTVCVQGVYKLFG